MFTFEDIHDTDKSGSYGVDIAGNYNSAQGNRDNSLNPIGGNRLPTFGLEYSARDSRRINRATVGDGLIIVGNDKPGALDGLNRNVAIAQEVTKDQNVYMDMYISPSAIGSLADGMDGDLGKAWAFIYTAPGLLAGGLDSLIKVLSGNEVKVSVDKNAYGFEDSFTGKIGEMTGGFRGITFGNVAHYDSDTTSSTKSQSYPRTGEGIQYPVDLGRHEEGHTCQYQYFGPSFPLFYYTNGPGDGNNFLEKGVDEYGAERNRANWKVRK